MQRILPISPRRRSRGFTIVELSVVIVVIGLIFPIFTVLLVNAYRDTFTVDDKVKTSAATMQAFWYMDDSVRASSAYLTAPQSQFSDNYGPNDNGTGGAEAWSYKGKSPTNRVLILDNYATSINGLNNGRMPVFKQTPAFNCTTEMTYQPQLNYMTIFYVKNNTLYKRLLTDTTSPLCPGNVQQQKQTCPPYIAAGSRHSSCQANDEILLTNVTEFTVRYYQMSQAGVSTEIDPSYAATTPDALDAADYATVTITASARPNGAKNTMTQRLTKVNQ